MAKTQSTKPQAPKPAKFVQVHYSELAGDTLSYAVADVLGKAEDLYKFGDDGSITPVGGFSPVDNWEQCGELFAQFHPTFSVMRTPQGLRSYYAILSSEAVSRVVGAHGADHRVALCRAVVLTGGEEQVIVPESFLPSQVEALAIERGESQGRLRLDSGPQDIAQVDAFKSTATLPPEVQDRADKELAGKPEAQAAKSQATPPTKPEAAPAATTKPQTGKPAPQGKHAQALASHAEKPAGKVGK